MPPGVHVSATSPRWLSGVAASLFRQPTTCVTANSAKPSPRARTRQGPVQRILHVEFFSVRVAFGPLTVAGAVPSQRADSRRGEHVNYPSTRRRSNDPRPSLAHPLTLALAVSMVACDASREGDQATDTTAPSATETTTSAGSAETASAAFLDPNAATREQLLALPGMDSAAAEALVRGRQYDMTAVDRALAATSPRRSVTASTPGCGGQSISTRRARKRSC